MKRVAAIVVAAVLVGGLGGGGIALALGEPSDTHAEPVAAAAAATTTTAVPVSQWAPLGAEAIYRKPRRAWSSSRPPRR